MKFTATTPVLQKAVAYVARAAATKNILHILGGLLLEADNDKLKISATNLELGIEYYIDATVYVPGSVVLPASVFNDIVRKTSEETITVDVDPVKHRAAITDGSFDVELAGLSSLDFPTLSASLSTEPNLIVSGEILLSMLNGTLYAMATNDIRPIFTGALFTIENEQFSVNATDGFRIGSSKSSCEYNGDVHKLVVPGKNCLELSRLISSIQPETIQIFIEHSQIIFQLEGLKLISKLIEGQYPDLRNFIPCSYHTTLLVDKKSLISSLERAALIVRDSQTGVVNLIYDDSQLTVVGKSNELGQHTEVLQVDGEGQTLKVSFTLRYILEIIKHMDADTLELAFAESYNLLVVRPANDHNTFGLLMPVTSN